LGFWNFWSRQSPGLSFRPQQFSTRLPKACECKLPLASLGILIHLPSLTSRRTKRLTIALPQFGVTV
jgi:hypothetical protein